MYNYDAEADDVSQELLNQKAMKETEIIQNWYECNTFLNSGLSYDELEKVISKLKNNCDVMVYQTKCCAIMMLPSHFSDFSQLFFKVVLY